MEEAMNAFYPFVGAAFVWSLKARVRGAIEAQYIWFTVQRNDLWVSDATEIGAALSLLLFAVHEEERKEHHDDEGLQKDWLRHGDKPLRKQSIRLLCRSTPASRRY
jgi:hypothetical protein